MHYSTLACHALTLFAISNAYPIHRWNRTLSDDSLSVNHERSQPRQAAPSIPTLVPAMKLLPSFFRPTTSSTSVPSGTSTSGGPRKYVVAHHMVGNTYPYKPQDWADDIALAHTFGIDGFALNIGKEEWEPARVSDAYAAALESGFDFKLFLSLDMTSLSGASPSDAQTLRDLVSAYVSHPNQLRYQSRAFVSTFSGETCTFGRGSAPDGWKNEFSKHPDLQGKIYFVPSFFIDPAKFWDFNNVMDGDFNWNSGWPIQVTTSFVQNLRSTPSSPLSISHNAACVALSGFSRLQNALSGFIGSTDTDQTSLTGLAGLARRIKARDQATRPAYMAAVSPWFFTHYGRDSFNKNFIYLSDQHLYSKRWDSLIGMRDQVDIVQVLTWNDYGESHYIGPIKGAQPNSQAWVDGMDHTAWLELTEYYATAFKTGQYPKIEKDKIFMWSRTHPARATAPDPVGPPDNFQLSEDAVWAVVMTTAPSIVTLSTSSANSQSFNVPAGLTKLSIPISAGDTMTGRIQRDGRTLVVLDPPEFKFQGSPQIYNFNAFVASAAAA